MKLVVLIRRMRNDIFYVVFRRRGVWVSSDTDPVDDEGGR